MVSAHALRLDACPFFLSFFPFYLPHSSSYSPQILRVRAVLAVVFWFITAPLWRTGRDRLERDLVKRLVDVDAGLDFSSDGS